MIKKVSVNFAYFFSCEKIRKKHKMKVRFKKSSSGTREPQESTIGSTCYDFFWARCVVLELVFVFPTSIYPRSSISLQFALVRGGMIDSDYRGNVRVILHNFSQKRVEFNTGDRIAQILFQKRESPDFIEVTDFDNYPTKRGTSGFGTTGI